MRYIQPLAVWPLLPSLCANLYYSLNIDLRRILYLLQGLHRDLYLILVSNAYGESPYSDRRLLKIVIVSILLYSGKNCPAAQSYNLCTLLTPSTISTALSLTHTSFSECRFAVAQSLAPVCLLTPPQLAQSRDSNASFPFCNI